jgi:NAD(P)-dependent dehydrogenase (short-subunit alcohol dehydrogenase family)
MVDRVAVVTGASRGIGKAIALHLGTSGYRVAVVGRSPDRGARVVGEIVGDGGVAEFFHCDVAVESSVAQLFTDVAGRWGGLDVVVNNAAKTDVTETDKSVTEMATEDFDAFLRTNVHSTFWSFKYGIPAMGAAGGSFITISSIAAVVSRPAEPGYGTSKAAAAALTRQVAVDYGAKGIRANVLMLGFVHTNATNRMLSEGPVGPAVRSATPGSIPTSQDVARAVAFLAAETAFNGATLTIDGGMTAVSPIPELG